MKTVLQDIKTRLFFRHMDEWTSSLEEAAGFRDTVAALRFCQRSNLAGVAVVQVYGNGFPDRIAAFHRRSAAASPAISAGMISNIGRPAGEPAAVERVS
jgi:hypothetical protein